MERLANTKLPIAHVLFTRGCPYHCNFCANQNHNIRYWSKENIIEELKLLRNNYGIQVFCITDDNFLIDKKKVLPIIDEIAKLGLKWSTLSRVDIIDHELLEKLKKSGCIEIKYGYPGENLKTTMETITLLENLKKYISRVGLTYFTYLPGSPIYPKNSFNYNHGVYCDSQVPWGTYEEKQEVLKARKILKKYIKKNFE